MRVVAVMPVSGRGELFPITIKRLRDQKGVDLKIVVICDTPEEASLALESGADAINHGLNNWALGDKWCHGMSIAEQYTPNAALLASSSVWYTPGYIQSMLPYLEEYDYVGLSDMYAVDFRQNEKKLLYWGGYHNNRKGQSLGAGRLLSRRILDRVDWQICNPNLNSQFDYSVNKTLGKVGAKSLAVGMNQKKMLKISCWKWKQLNSFFTLAQNPLAKFIPNVDDWLKEYFPEAMGLFK